MISAWQMLPVALLVSDIRAMLLFTMHVTMFASSGQRAYFSMSALMLVLRSGVRQLWVMLSKLGLFAMFVLMNLMNCG